MQGTNQVKSVATVKQRLIQNDNNNNSAALADDSSKILKIWVAIWPTENPIEMYTIRQTQWPVFNIDIKKPA